MGRDWAGGFGIALPVRRKDYGQSSKPPFHSFLPYASSVLSKESYDYDILDSQRLKYNKFQVLRDVKKRNPGVIFSLIGLPSLKKDLELLGMIKESLPNTLVVGVGTICRVVQNDILLKSKIDLVLRNSYPYVSNLLDLIKTIELRQNLKKVHGISYVKDRNVITTVESPDVGLDKLPPPHYDALQLDGYENFVDLDGNRYDYIPILGSKGCPYSCIYCPYPLGFGKKWTHRSPNDIVDEIEYLCTRGVKGFLFRDQSFPMNKKYATRICKEIIHRKLHIAWFCEARVDHISRDLLEIMKKAGCKRIHYGVETGDPWLIKWGKPQTDLDTIRKAFRLTKEAGLWTNAHIILGWPEESLESLAETSRFVTKIDSDSANWNVLTPYPGTKLYEMVKEANLILTHDWSKYTSHEVVMKTKWLNAIELQKAINKIKQDYLKKRIRKLLLYTMKKPRFVANELKNIIEGYLM